MKRLVFFITMLLITVTVIASPKPKFTTKEMMRKHYGASDVIFRGTMTDNFKRAPLDTGKNSGEEGMLIGSQINLEAMCMINNSSIINDPKFKIETAEWESRPKFLRMSLDYDYLAKYSSDSIALNLGIQYAQATTCNFKSILGSMRGYWYGGPNILFRKEIDVYNIIDKKITDKINGTKDTSYKYGIHQVGYVGLNIGTSLYSVSKFFTASFSYYPMLKNNPYQYNFEMGNLINNRYMFSAGLTNNNPKVNITYMTTHLKFGTNVKLINNKLNCGINLGFTF